MSLVRRLKRFDKLRSTLRALWASIRKPNATCTELFAVVVATCGPRFVRLRPHPPEVVRDALSFGLGFSVNIIGSYQLPIKLLQKGSLAPIN